MTERTREILPRLRLRQEGGEQLLIKPLIQELLKEGLDPVEVGWLVSHVLDYSMGLAVHLATVESQS